MTERSRLQNCRFPNEIVLGINERSRLQHDWLPNKIIFRIWPIWALGSRRLHNVWFPNKIALGIWLIWALCALGSRMIDCPIRLYLESDRSGLSAPAAAELMISQKDYTRNLTDLGTGRSRFQNGWFLDTILLGIWPICAPLRAGRRGACLTRLAPWDGKVVLVCFHTFSYRKTILSQIDPNGAIHIYIYVYVFTYWRETGG